AGYGGLEVLCQQAASVEQSESSLDDPASRQQDEPLGRVGSLDDFDIPAAIADECLFKLRSGIAAVGKDVAQPRQQRADRCQQRQRAVAVLNVGGMHLSAPPAPLGGGT